MQTRNRNSVTGEGEEERGILFDRVTSNQNQRELVEVVGDSLLKPEIF
jgi:hypothetical protein